MISAVMGVDPGVNGGLAVLRLDGVVVHVRAFNDRMTREELSLAVRQGCEIVKSYDSREAYLEKVGYIAGDGGQGAFTFGRVYGGLEQALLAHGMAVRDVMPMAWQTRLECLTGGNKNVSKRVAQRFFPDMKITHAVADALLIAEYGRRRIAPSGR